VTNFEDEVPAQRLSELGSIIMEIHKVQKLSSGKEYVSSSPVNLFRREQAGAGPILHFEVGLS
jgi:hypothetical protein